MSTLRKPLAGGLGAVAATLVVLLALPGVAHAAALGSETVTTGSAATSTWDFSTTTAYWSIVGVYSDSDYDLDLSAGGTRLASSLYGSATTDFIAIDSNAGRRALGNYRATVRRFSGTANFAVEQMQGRFVTNLPVPTNDSGASGPSDPNITFATIDSGRVVRVSDIFLSAGEAFWIKTTNLDGNVFFLESDPSAPSTFIRTRSSAVSSAAGRVVDGCTIYTAHFTGWHAIAVVNNSVPIVTDPRSGTGFPIMRYRPSRPTSCPVKNFPGATP